MFFKKKKKEVLLNHGLLAEALMCLTVKNWYDFERKTKQFIENPWHYNPNIRIDEHIRFELSNFDTDYRYSFHVDTYIDDIKVNSYFFILDSKNYSSDFWQEWKLLNKHIYHPLPDFIIKQINDFSETCVNKKHQQLNADKKKEESRDKTIWQKEENKLQEVFKSYEQKQ